jgi:hypothetical protein
MSAYLQMLAPQSRRLSLLVRKNWAANPATEQGTLHVLAAQQSDQPTIGSRDQDPT